MHTHPSPFSVLAMVETRDKVDYVSDWFLSTLVKKDRLPTLSTEV